MLHPMKYGLGKNEPNAKEGEKKTQKNNSTLFW